MLNPQLSHHLDHFQDSDNDDGNDGTASTKFHADPSRTWNRPVGWSLLMKDKVELLVVLVVSIVVPLIYCVIDFYVILGGLFVGTGGCLVIFHWNRRREFRRRLDWQRARNRVSQKLALVGAPLLPLPHADLMIEAHGMEARVENMVQVHVDFLQTVAQVLVVLRCSTSVRLGVHTKCVVRVEKFAELKVSSIPLNTLRQRLYQALAEQTNALLDLIGSDKSTKNTNMFQETPKVVTTSLLQSMQRDLTSLLSETAEYALSLGFDMSKLDRVMQSVCESRHYFECCLQCVPQNSDPVFSKVQLRLEQLLSLTVAGYQSEGEERWELWTAFRREFALLQDVVRSANNQFEQQLTGKDDTDEGYLTTNDDLLYSKVQSQDGFKSGEYTAGDLLGEAIGAKSTQASTDSGSQKVLVYSGKGSSRTGNKQKMMRDKNASRTLPQPPVQLPVRDPLTESMLMEELTRRLRSMPPLEEISATPHYAINVSDEDKNGARSFTEETLPETKNTGAGFSGGLLPDLMAELSRAIPGAEPNDEILEAE